MMHKPSQITTQALKKPSTICAIISVFFCIIGVPWFAWLGPKLIAIVGATGGLLLLSIIDDQLFKRCNPIQERRIVMSRFLLSITILFPFAASAEKHTWANFTLDLLSYTGSVLAVSIMGAARIEPTTPFWDIKAKKYLGAAFIATLSGYLAVMLVQTMGYHNAYSVGWFDGAFEFAPLWQTVRGHFFRIINEFSEETSILRYHWPLIYFYLSPITLLWSDPRIALVLQTLFFALCACAILPLARHYTGSKPFSLWIGTIFLLYLPVHLANTYSFHSDSLAMPFLFLCFFFAARKKWVYYGAMVAAALMCKEYVGLAFLGYGLWLARENRWAGLLTSFCGLAWFLFVVQIGIPLFNEGAPAIVLSSNYGDIGGHKGLIGMAQYLLRNFPGVLKGVFLMQSNIAGAIFLLLPLLFVPLRRPAVLLCAILIIVKNALSATGIFLSGHRETPYLPFIFLALILYFSSVRQSSLKRFQILGITIAALTTLFLQGHTFPCRGYWLTREYLQKSNHDNVCDKMIAKIPRDAVVMATDHLTSHLMTRKWYFLFPRFPTPRVPEYIMVDVTGKERGKQREEHDSALESLLANQRYRLLESVDGAYLFKLKQPP